MESRLHLGRDGVQKTIPEKRKRLERGEPIPSCPWLLLQPSFATLHVVRRIGASVLQGLHMIEPDTTEIEVTIARISQSNP